MTSFVSVFCKKSGFSPRLTLSLWGRIDIETRPTISNLNVRGIQLNSHGNLLGIVKPCPKDPLGPTPTKSQYDLKLKGTGADTKML